MWKKLVVFGKKLGKNLEESGRSKKRGWLEREEKEVGARRGR